MKCSLMSVTRWEDTTLYPSAQREKCALREKEHTAGHAVPAQGVKERDTLQKKMMQGDKVIEECSRMVFTRLRSHFHLPQDSLHPLLNDFHLLPGRFYPLPNGFYPFQSRFHPLPDDFFLFRDAFLPFPEQNYKQLSRFHGNFKEK
jgi:hypothetical protein